MTNTLTTILAAVSTILGVIALPKLYESIKDGYVAWVGKKNGNIEKLRQKIKRQEEKIKLSEAEIELLKNQLNAMTLRMEIIIPLLRKQLKDDPEAIELLEHFDLKTNVTSSKT